MELKSTLKSLMITFTTPLKRTMKTGKFKCQLYLMLAGSAMFLMSCGEQSVTHASDDEQNRLDSAKTAIINVSGVLFSIPSPVQTTLLVKNSGAAYDKGMLNNPGKYSDYVTNDIRAINAGIYGTDMAYASVFEDGQSALQAYKALDNLAEELGITGAVDPGLLQRIAVNVGNTDSLLMLSGVFYSEADAYLKENQRYDIAALVLTGGWIESTYLTMFQARSGNAEAITRIAEQKPTVKTIKNALAKTCSQEFLKGDIYKYILDLDVAYEQVTNTYKFVEPETMPEEKTTVLKSSSSYTMNTETMNQIGDILTALRNTSIQ